MKKIRPWVIGVIAIVAMIILLATANGHTYSRHN
jgi:hypothetical protein